MSVALFAADYMAARASSRRERRPGRRLPHLIQRQSAMTEKHQAARDMVLRALPRGGGFREDDRVMLWNMFVDMLQLLDTLVATHTDYASLRRPGRPRRAGLHARRPGKDVAGAQPRRSGRLARPQD